MKKLKQHVLTSLMLYGIFYFILCFVTYTLYNPFFWIVNLSTYTNDERGGILTLLCFYQMVVWFIRDEIMFKNK